MFELEVRHESMARYSGFDPCSGNFYVHLRIARTEALH
jgi:hypothetical protein